MLKVDKVVATSFLVCPRDKLAFFGDTYASLGSILFSRPSFSCFSPYSSLSYSFSTFSFGSSSVFSASIFISSSSFSPSSSSSFHSLPPTLEAGVSSGVRVYVLMMTSLSMFMNLDQRIMILIFFMASTTISFMRPWWPRS